MYKNIHNLQKGDFYVSREFLLEGSKLNAYECLYDKPE
jgi:hypothetical protein